MPSFSRHDVILVRYPFSDLADAKIRPAVVVGRSRRGDLLVVPLTSRVGNLDTAEFLLNDWRGAGLNVASAVKRGIYTVHDSVVLKAIGRLSATDGAQLDSALPIWLELG